MNPTSIRSLCGFCAGRPAAALAAAAAVFALSAPRAAGAPDEPIDAVLVVQNHASDEFQKPLSNLGDALSAALSGDLFNVIDPNDAVGEEQNRGPWGENMPLSAATRLAENLDAQALFTAAVGEASVVGYGAPARVQAVRMRMTLSAKSLPKGANVAAVTVSETSRKFTPETLSQDAERIYGELVESLVAKAAAEFLAKCDEPKVAARLAAMRPNLVEVAFGCNFPGADVAIDGVSYGTAGTVGEAPLRVRVSDGLHNLVVSYPYTEPFEVRAKFQPGTTFMVVLRENEEGRRIRKEDAHFDALMDRISKSGATDDQVRLLRARGYGKYLASSYTRIQGMPQVLTMRDCEMPDFGLNPDREGDGVQTTTQDLLDSAGAALGLPSPKTGTPVASVGDLPASLPQPDGADIGGGGVPDADPAPSYAPSATASDDGPSVATAQTLPASAPTDAGAYAPAPVSVSTSTADRAPPAPSPGPTLQDLQDFKEGLETGKDIIQGIQDIRNLLK